MAVCHRSCGRRADPGRQPDDKCKRDASDLVPLLDRDLADQFKPGSKAFSFNYTVVGQVYSFTLNLARSCGLPPELETFAQAA